MDGPHKRLIYILYTQCQTDGQSDTKARAAKQGVVTPCFAARALVSVIYTVSRDVLQN